MKGSSAALELLKRHFGHSQFRPGQETLVNALLSGQDVLGVMPTGAGKSICYQLPALLLPGLALVVSPLISLMKDQVAALKQAGIPCACVHSALSWEEAKGAYRQAWAGECRLLYVAPERLLAPELVRLAQERRLSLLAVDEAHCVSQWGQDFRPSYLEIPAFIGRLKERPAVGAFTATATPQVREDIEKLLGLREPQRVTTGFDRPNLYFEVVRPRDKLGYLREYVAQRPRESGVVYCATRKAVDGVYQRLLQDGVPAARYHAGLEDQERRQNQEDFVFDRARVMVATNAFGMGIDKSNVGYVLHYNMPKNLESYYQEAGRAGRDGSPARCTLLFSPGDVQTAKYLISQNGENEALPEKRREELRQLELARLDKMAAYCKTAGCLRACLVRYFGEEAPDSCGHCGSCSQELVVQDITLEAQKILSGVARAERKYSKGLGASLIVKMLRGSGERRVRQLDLDSLSTYGILREQSQERLAAYIDCLEEQGYLRTQGDQYPVLRTTARAREVLTGGAAVSFAMRKPAAPAREEKPVPAASPGAGPLQEDLYEELRALRSQLARAENVPAYMIFSNASLADMAAKQPGSRQELLEVSGVGQVKAQRYGSAFLERIAAWQEKQGAGD